MRTLLLPLLLLAFPLHAQQWNWAASAGGGGNVDFCYGIATDSQGNAYWVGTVSGTVAFGCGTVATGNSDIAGFIAKRGPDGSCQWVRPITVGFNDVWVYGVAIDAQDRIYITGSYDGNATFGDGITLNSLGSDDIFVARYTTDGTCLWARRAGSSGSSDEARGVAVSADGGVFIAGHSGGTTIGFDGITIPNAGNWRQLVIARYDSTGTVQWARASQGNGQGKTCRAISVASDRLFVTGQIGASVATFDGLALTPGSSGAHLYVLGTDLAGNGLWARPYGTGDHEGMGIAADTLGNVFVAARMWGSLFLPDDTLTSTSSNDDILLLKLDRDGLHHWARSTGSTQRDLAWDVDADGLGNVLVAAQFNQSINFFGTPFTALGGEDILIAKLDGDGEVLWAARPSGFQRDIPLCIHRQAAAPHALYFGGYFWGAITYGSTTIDDVLNGDAMIVAGLDTTFHVSALAQAICPGACDGMAQAFVTGTAPFSYLWSVGATTPIITGLCAGEYIVEVIDADGTVRIDTVLVEEHPDPGYTVQQLGDSLWVAGGTGWQWYLNSTTELGDSASTIALVNGDYHALVTDAFGCTWSTDTLTFLTTGLSTRESTPGLRVAPNPVRDVLFIEHAGDTVLTAELLNSTGQRVRVIILDPGRTSVDLSALPTGLYMLHVAGGDVVRVVVE
jgi:hypothetical protein